MTQISHPPPACPAAAASGAQPVVVLPARLTPAEAGALAAQLLLVVAAENPTLDGSATDTVGVAGLQVLAAFIQERGARPFQWRAPSAALLCGARDAGLCAALALPPQPPPHAGSAS